MPDPPAQVSDVTRRTWLAAERTWLAWWRSGVAVGAVALALGRFLPELTHRHSWQFRALGVGYGLLSVAVLIVGAVRQRRGAEALRNDTFSELSSPVVNWLTGVAILLSVVSTVLVLTTF
jgi:putative membrane protein